MRKPIKSAFSSLEQFEMAHLHCRNLQILKFRAQTILLIDLLMFETSKKEVGLSLKYPHAYV